ncbi:hypothetical protein Thiosp_03048 [Thiorhodovibrio litoralis]|nr:hypothetical protein Thiosp_03048 [Thiorhodovibrio litoralis]
MVILGDKNVVRAALDQVGSELALGEERVGGEGFAGKVEGIEHRDRHPDLPLFFWGAFQLIAAIDGQRADFFWV